MIVSTTHSVPGQEDAEILGLVRGNTVRSRHLGRDITAIFKQVVGGEVIEYTKLIAEAREQALDRMVEEAHAMGADAIVSLRFQTCEVAKGAAEMLAYGTAVTFVEGDDD